jgi:hypothetical protein
VIGDPGIAPDNILSGIEILFLWIATILLINPGFWNNWLWDVLIGYLRNVIAQFNYSGGLGSLCIFSIGTISL